MRLAGVLIVTALLAGCSGSGENGGAPADSPSSFVPHVILGMADTGINPYHQVFYRPHLHSHPCTYLRDFPCEVKELRLTVGTDDFAAALAADQAAWDAVERETWYWIPQTVFVAVRCDSVFGPMDAPPSPRTDPCILEDDAGTDPEAGAAAGGHGTGTTSLAIAENPDALLAFNEGFYGEFSTHFTKEGIPVDVVSFSYSRGTFAPQATAAVRTCPLSEFHPIEFHSAGNDAQPVWSSCWSGHARAITVGGGFTQPRAHDSTSGNAADIENYVAPEYARRDSATQMNPPGTEAGTSFAVPAAAGALSKVILELRRTSGYDGTLTNDGMVDPVLGISIGELRDAMNRTATYEPNARHVTPPNPGATARQIPLNPLAPWLQWGWGFYDRDAANVTIEHLLGIANAPAKPDAAVEYMEQQYAIRRTLYGS